MKSPHHTTATQELLTPQQIAAWSLDMHTCHQRLASCFVRPQPRRHALLYLQAVLSDVPRKNGWQIAEQAHQARPYGIQRLLSHAVWDQDRARDELRRLILDTLQPPPVEADRGDPSALFPVLILDESGMPKRGRHSAGVAKQYCSILGQVANCQVGVFLSYVTARGHGLLDRELYLPEDWCADSPRRQAAHIPAALGFATKPELARLLVQRAHAAGLPIRWAVADTVYGHCTELRLFLEQQGFSYALAIPSLEHVSVQTKSGPLLADVKHLASHAVERDDWLRLCTRVGTKGSCPFDWAILPLLHQGQVDGRHFLVFRREVDESKDLSFYLVWVPLDTPFPLIVAAIGCRWHIEEDLQQSKKLGLDHYEVRSYAGWYRHITLVLLAAAVLLGICVSQEPASAAVPPRPEEEPPVSPIALTRSEVQHLLAHLLFPPPTNAPFLCAWSTFRRRHQGWASFYHRRRRHKSTASETSA